MRFNRVDIMILVSFIVIVLVVTTPVITGFIVSEAPDKIVSENFDIPFTDSYTADWQPSVASDEVISQVSVSGKYSGEGDLRIFLIDGEEEFLLYDNTVSVSPLTGFFVYGAVKKADKENKPEKENDNENTGNNNKGESAPESEPESAEESPAEEQQAEETVEETPEEVPEEIPEEVPEEEPEEEEIPVEEVSEETTEEPEEVSVEEVSGEEPTDEEINETEEEIVEEEISTSSGGSRKSSPAVVIEEEVPVSSTSTSKSTSSSSVLVSDLETTKLYDFFFEDSCGQACNVRISNTNLRIRIETSDGNIDGMIYAIKYGLNFLEPSQVEVYEG